MKTCEHCGQPLEKDLPFCVHCGAELNAFPKVSERYAITALLGEGGMGEVYRALDKQTQKQVAIKIIRSSLLDDTKIIERFEQESKALASIVHPQLVSVLTVGKTQDNRPFFVMPFLEGPDLGDYVGAKKLPYPKAVEIVVALLEAVAALHEKGWVHRDIKASNVILTENATVPVLLDMGVARSIQQDAPQITMLGEVIGTPEAMAPEQITGGTIDARTDIYQAGALLLFLLLGKPVFSAESTKSLYGMQLNQSPELGAGLPLPIVQVCLKAMEKNPEDRYASARDMIGALTGKPVPKKGFFSRFKK
jgi:eukaryotic-like serine/threonine-protein kinase